MSTETTTSPAAVVQAGFEAFGKGDVAGFTAMFHPDATWNHHNDDHLGGIHHGIDGIMAFLGESGERTAGTLRAVPLAVMSGDDGLVAVRMRVSATRPDGRTHDDTQMVLFVVEGDRVRSVDQYIGDPAAVTAFWA
jgi:ketosteroid isomerase-like protein